MGLSQIPERSVVSLTKVKARPRRYRLKLDALADAGLLRLVPSIPGIFRSRPAVFHEWSTCTKACSRTPLRPPKGLSYAHPDFMRYNGA